MPLGHTTLFFFSWIIIKDSLGGGALLLYWSGSHDYGKSLLPWQCLLQETANWWDAVQYNYSIRSCQHSNTQLDLMAMWEYRTGHLQCTREQLKATQTSRTTHTTHTHNGEHTSHVKTNSGAVLSVPDWVYIQKEFMILCDITQSWRCHAILAKNNAHTKTCNWLYTTDCFSVFFEVLLACLWRPRLPISPKKSLANLSTKKIICAQSAFLDNTVYSEVAPS